MALYREGKAAMAADGTVTGTGTKWQSSLSLIRPGATIMFLSSPIQMAVVNKVVSDTEIKAITTNGAVVASTDYAILLSDSLTVDGLAQDVAETLRYYQSQETEIADAVDFFKNFDFEALQSLANQVKADSESAYASAAAAAASESNAKTSETNSKSSENAAKDSEIAAETARDQVQQIIDGAGEQSTLVVLAQPDGYTKVGGIKTRWDSEEKSVIYAVTRGVVESSSIDSSDILQGIIDSAGSTPIILPSQIALSKTVKYRSRTCLRGRDGSYSVVNMLPGFVGASAFAPISKEQGGTDSSILDSLTITDLSAVNDGKGSTSNLDGIDITGSYNISCRNISGVRVKNTISSEIGSAVQHTRRARIDGLNGSNVDRHIYMPGTNSSRFAYGDLYVSNFKTTGSCKKMSVIECTDGLHVFGGVIFPNGGLRVSGHYINISGSHMFEPKAELGSGETPSGIHVSKRSETEFSRDVNISGTAIAFPGRLSDTTSGNPPQTNEPAPGLFMERVIGFNVSITVNQSSMESARLVNCQSGVISLASRDSNTQALGSGALAPGTYDTLLLTDCTNVAAVISDTSPSRRYAVNVSDGCKGVSVSGTVSRGFALGTDVYCKNIAQNRVSITVEGASESRTQQDTTPAIAKYVNAPAGDVTPSVTNGVNNLVVSFQNSAITNVTDLPDVTSRREVTIWINDNNATRIIDVSNGGMFKTRNGANITGRGTFARFIRDPATGYLFQL